jgi:hypothetical protein
LRIVIRVRDGGRRDRGVFEENVRERRKNWSDARLVAAAWSRCAVATAVGGVGSRSSD